MQVDTFIGQDLNALLIYFIEFLKWNVSDLRECLLGKSQLFYHRSADPAVICCVFYFSRKVHKTALEDGFVIEPVSFRDLHQSADLSATP